MFVFEFKNRLQFYSSRLFKDEVPIVWKITITGPFVTLYSTTEFGKLLSKTKNYSFIHPHFIEHLSAHGANSLGGYVLEILEDNHSHVVLPCKQNPITELTELLQLLAKHSKEKLLINQEWIAPCLKAYQSYLDKMSPDDCKNHLMNLILKWAAPEIDRSIVRDLYQNSGIKKGRKNPPVIPSIEDLQTKIAQCVATPNLNNYELVRVECTELFAKLNTCTAKTSTEIVTNLLLTVPHSSTLLFTRFTSEHLHLVFGTVCFSFFSGLLLLNSLGLNDLVAPYAFAFLIYAPNLAEKSYAALSNWITETKKALFTFNSDEFCAEVSEGSTMQNQA